VSYAAASIAATAAAVAIVVLCCFGLGKRRPNGVVNLVSEFVQ